ncbi:uncharacterized protein LOC117782586 [Drosophila innubila]|uniref:uncharacterized protein LOC117782586 n=1 Tax=Drosophila innubila TaxID=198719 RepID=UPI00148CD642|nr:uncharacterized protein LOC117782586 [Drosophila innubila]
MTTIEQVNCYFANLNPVAEKIAFDIREVKSAYDHVWLTLSSIEQDDILNDTIIRPEITIRYYKNPISPSSQSSKDVPRLTVVSNKKATTKCQKSNNIIYTYDRQHLSTFIYQKTGLKMIHDENIGDYRDEHSYPFSYKTKSQINLSVIVSNTNTNSMTVKDNDLYKPFIQVDTKHLTPVPTKALNKLNDPDHDHDQVNDHPNTTQELIYGDDDEHYNPLTNSGSKNTLLGNLTDSTDSENETKYQQHAENCKLLPEKVQIPKGFDFLSNW